MNQTRILSLVSVAVAILCFLSSCKADFVGNSYKINNNWYMDFSVLNETERKEFSLLRGDEISVDIALTDGTVEIEILDGNKTPVYRGKDLVTEQFSVVIPTDGRCSISVTGHNAKGKISFENTGR